LLLLAALLLLVLVTPRLLLLVLVLHVFVLLLCELVERSGRGEAICDGILVLMWTGCGGWCELKGACCR
jgi:hypothetical protein